MHLTSVARKAGHSSASADRSVRHSFDAGAIAKLCAEAFRGIPGCGEGDHFLDKTERILGGRYGPLVESASLIAVDADSAVTGVILVTEYAPYGAPVVALIATAPSVRRQGAGRALLDRSIEEMTRLGIRHCCANIDSGNGLSEAFFSACGFVAETDA